MADLAPDFNLLPPSIRRDERSRAFLETLWSLIVLDLRVLQIYRVRSVSGSALNALSHHLDVQGLKGWSLARNEQEQRELLAIAFDLHRYAGSRYALKRALAWLGYDQEFIVIENPGNYHDGLSVPRRDGSQLRNGARVGEFAIRTYGDRPFDSFDIGLIVSLIEAWKPVSRKLFDLYINDIPVLRRLRYHDGVYRRDGTIDRTGYDVLDVQSLLIEE